MDGLRKILVYDDNPEYGGHQVMAAYGLEALLVSGEFEVVFWYNQENSKWKNRISQFDESSKLIIDESPTRTKKLQLLRNYWQRCKKLRQRLRVLNPDLILFIQGDIEHSSLAMLEALRLGFPVASYIPMCHSYKLMKAKLGGIRDAFSRRVYKSVGGWITISESIGSDLLALSPGSTVLVVENGIQISRFTDDLSDSVRSGIKNELGLCQMIKTCALVGRIEFNQKCQDLALMAFEQYSSAFDGWELVYVGSGPDEIRLDKMIAESPLRSRIKRIAWLDNPERVYAAIDCLLIPSRYEGGPLVMLEALASGLSVIGSDRDGMRDLLPVDWRFESGNMSAMADTFKLAASGGFKGLDAVRQRVLSENDLSNFKNHFVGAVRQLVHARS